MSLGARLKKSRLKMGFSQEFVANLLNLHRTTIGKYENDECIPSVEILSRLIEIYCEDANYILFGKTRRIINIEYVSKSIEEKLRLIIARHILEKNK
ncbi:MAG: helix-turn-helix domain-containing protein [Massilimicrobiota timonensis]